LSLNSLIQCILMCISLSLLDLKFVAHLYIWICIIHQVWGVSRHSFFKYYSLIYSPLCFSLGNALMRMLACLLVFHRSLVSFSLFSVTLFLILDISHCSVLMFSKSVFYLLRSTVEPLMVSFSF
jgi:hypothetical protein